MRTHNIRTLQKSSFKVRIGKEQSFVAGYKDNKKNYIYYPFTQTDVIR